MQPVLHSTAKVYNDRIEFDVILILENNQGQAGKGRRDLKVSIA